MESPVRDGRTLSGDGSSAERADAAAFALAVVGMGLIGGSFYKAARRAGFTVAGLHHGETDGLGDAYVVLVCLPPDAIVPWIRAHAPLFRPGAVVIDICGVKTPVCRAAAEIAKGQAWRFLGGHPMAGKEVSGFANATADLFDGKSMVLCPVADEPEGSPSPTGIPALRRLFRALGFARTVVTTPERHDEMIAFTSQLGHVIASAYVQDPHMEASVGFSAGSFANMSRIATIDPETWTSLYLADRDALLGALDGFLGRMRAFRDALDRRDDGAIRAFIAAGAAAKRQELEKARAET